MSDEALLASLAAGAHLLRGDQWQYRVCYLHASEACWAVLGCVFLQDMEAAFRTNATASAAVIACFVFAVGVSSLTWGPFCDLLGCKPTYLASTAMYAAATVGCIFSQNISMMLVFRTLQGAAREFALLQHKGGCAGCVTGAQPAATAPGVSQCWWQRPCG